MLDQMFTAENFRLIFDIENRQGLDVASRFFPSVEPYTLAVRDKVSFARKLVTGFWVRRRLGVGGLWFPQFRL